VDKPVAGISGAQPGSVLLEMPLQKNAAFDFESSWTWDLRTHESYIRDAARVQFPVTVNRESLRHIFELLTLDWRIQGMHGMILTKDVTVRDLASGSDVLLQKHDRLEAYGSVYDVHCSPETLPNPSKLFVFSAGVRKSS